MYHHTINMNTLIHNNYTNCFQSCIRSNHDTNWTEIIRREHINNFTCKFDTWSGQTHSPTSLQTEHSLFTHTGSETITQRYKNIHTHTHTVAYIHTHIHTHTVVQTHTQQVSHTLTHTHTHTHTQWCTHTHTHGGTRTRTHTVVHTHTHTHTHACTYNSLCQHLPSIFATQCFHKGSETNGSFAQSDEKRKRVPSSWTKIILIIYQGAGSERNERCPIKRGEKFQAAWPYQHYFRW